MKIRISKATIVDTRHADNGKVRDILIENGTITKIAENIADDADEVIEADGLCVSIGWFDFRANFRDPGDETKEDFNSGLAAAANGGFTQVALSPDTNPPVDRKGMVRYTLQKAMGDPVEAIQIGAVSKNMEGKHLSEMYDMYMSGAKAFGDAQSSLSEAGILQRALLYAQGFNAPILHFPYDVSISRNGQINEGPLSTQLGLKGIPAMAEEMVVRRDLTILDYTKGILHLGPLSSQQSIQLIAEAKSEGMKVTCETTAAHLAFNEDVLSNFDSFYKIQPPLRSEENRKQLIKMLGEGQIDILSSNHLPEDEEHKKLEFDYAQFGQANIEAFFPIVWNACSDSVPLDKLVATFTLNPRKLLSIDIPEIAEGATANLTLFSRSEKTQIERTKLQTKAYNVLPDGVQLKGRVLGIVSKGTFTRSKW
jgi:dihydroorotase